MRRSGGSSGDEQGKSELQRGERAEDGGRAEL